MFVLCPMVLPLSIFTTAFLSINSGMGHAHIGRLLPEAVFVNETHIKVNANPKKHVKKSDTVASETLSGAAG